MAENSAVLDLPVLTTREKIAAPRLKKEPSSQVEQLSADNLRRRDPEALYREITRRAINQGRSLW